MKLSDEEIDKLLRDLTGLPEPKGYGVILGNTATLRTDMVISLCREVLAARRFRDKHYNESSEEADAYDRARNGGET